MARHSTTGPPGDTLSPMPAKQPAKKPQLTVEQIEVVGQFADYAFDYPILTFDEVARKVMRSRPFPKTQAGREFKRQAKEIFDQERQK
jgi:hypothetical protein